MKSFLKLLSGVGVAYLLSMNVAYASHVEYQVTITNLTRGESFTPILVTTHRAGVHMFKLGDAPSTELAALAEGGDTAPMAAYLEATGKVAGMANTGGLLDPGKTVTVTVKANRHTHFISLAGMLIPTNDGFVALNSVRLPLYGTATYYAPAYDAGSEPNDEQCANIPGPVCGGIGGSPEAGGEGFVHIHSGIHSNGDDVNVLNSKTRDWRNPVAVIHIKRIK